MKTLTVRLPDALVAEIEAESQARKVSKSDVVRERLSVAAPGAPSSSLSAISDLIGIVDGLPPGLSADRKTALKATHYGRKRPG
ncbi:CopG family transcriptional regulator [Rhodoplanes roseus]|uniref:Ribbon-helix-helix protein CopG domain-containing protein n=1 Tax=Rhodoplanes roseus TaxID=29409 RepID=A0A327L271_9BRAD|nr:ribbon-helix-helix protein, CopG family [Rhodoplanes roseus]RAI44075.1 hypothetical protein CH341_11115 [Rhodoplanes roseus]